MVLVYKSGKLAVNGGDLAYRLFDGQHGQLDSAPIVLIAGWGSTMNDWHGLPQELAKRGRSVLLFDNRGIGLSAEHGGKVSVEDLAADVLGLADGLLSARPFVAFGHSAGAFVAQHLAIHAPNRVAAMVCCGSQGVRATAVAGSAEFFKLGRATFHAKISEPMSGVSSAWVPSAEASTELESRMKLYSYFLDTRERDVVDRDFQGMCERSLKENRPKATIQSQLGMLAKADYGPRLAEIRCPALVMHGADDSVIPMANAETLYKDLSGSSQRRLKVLPGLHFHFAPSLTAASAAAGEVVSFMAECEVPASKL
jgi:pimeloyl-ACP methyl ester carboxylesterase